jgi:CheY-like chemotaxis protein/HPt (histidine-containing phosphotransfer) domain-containing protein
VVLQPRNRSTSDWQNSIKVRSAPWLPSELLHAVAVALGLASPASLASQHVGQLTKQGEAPTVAQAEAEGQLILVAEDNETNREVIARQLGMLGYAHVVGDDGADALELWRKHRIGLVLTDCHMPHMDGYALSGAIRADEQDTEGRVPIVALTANALKGEAERCYAAGMDDYLTKPVELHQLRKVLDKWLTSPADGKGPREVTGDQHSAENTVAKTTAVASAPAVDPGALTKIVGDDPVVIASFLKKFVPQAQAILSDLDSAYVARDADAVRFLSHKLKSSARAIGATHLGELCANLETAGRRNAWSEIEQLHAQLKPAMAAVVDYIDSH